MAERLFQVGIKGLATNSVGKILLVSLDDGQGGTRWDIPGGRMDENETFLQTLDRELREEIGTSYTGDPELIATVLSDVSIALGDQKAGLILLVYRVQLETYESLQLNDYETGYDWFESSRVAELLSYKYPNSFTATIRSV